MKMRYLRAIILLLTGTVTLQVSGQNQTFDGCLSHAQLYELYRGDVFSMGQMMGRQRFFMVSNENNASFAWGNDTLHFSLCNWQFSQGFNDIYVNAFYKEGFYNFVEYNTTADCANKLLKECKEIYMEQYDENEDTRIIDTFVRPNTHNLSEAKKQAPQLTFDFNEGYRIVFPEEKEGNGLFLIQCYSPANIQQLILDSKTQQEQLNIARQIKEQTILQNMALADSLAQLGSFPEAIKLLEEVYDLLPEYIGRVDTKMGIIKKQYKEYKIKNYTEEGDRLYSNGDYEGAKEMYAKVLKEDLNNQNATERISSINRKLDILQQRGQITYEYSESNPQQYSDFCDALENELNQLVNNTDNGSLRMDFSIIFDTLGINQSFYNIISFNTISTDKNLPVLQNRMSSLLGHPALQPSYREEIPIRSSSTFNIDLGWNSYQQIIVKKRKKTVNKSPYALNPVIEDKLASDPRMHYGTYHFLTKNKSCNDKNFQDISLTKYKTVGGEAFFYGLVPGMGTLIATQGKEGVACMVLSLAFYGGAIASYVLYKDYKKQYNETSATLDEKDAKSLNTKKEVCKWAAIGGVSIGGSIHLGGMIKAMVRGIQNKKASKELRQALKNEPIEIQKENIHLQ